VDSCEGFVFVLSLGGVGDLVGRGGGIV